MPATSQTTDTGSVPDALGAYLQTIGQHPLLSAEEEYTLGTAILAARTTGIA
jgi:hypothetical protein